jgi:hypothetical protein
MVLCCMTLSAQTPVADYDFLGNSQDASPNGNHATANGVTLTADRNGNANSAYSFDGNDWLFVNGTSSLNTAAMGGITMMSWFKVTADAAGTDERIIYIGDPTFLNYEIMYRPTTKKIAFINYVSGPGTNIWIESATDIQLGQWYHVAVTMDHSTNATKLFINGVKEAMSATPAVKPSNPDLYIGANDPNGWYITGAIDRVTIYNSALADANVVSIYNSQSVTTGAGALAGMNASFSIYPNPTNTGIFTLNVPFEAGSVCVTVQSAEGKTVYTSLPEYGFRSKEVDLSALGSGMYIVYLNADDKVFTQKLIIGK